MEPQKPNLKLIVKMINQQAAIGNVYASLLEMESLIYEEIHTNSKEESDV